MPFVDTLRGRSVAESADGTPSSGREFNACAGRSASAPGVGLTGRSPGRLSATGTWIPEDGLAREDVEVDSEQLHGRACIVCGSTLDGLMDAGHFYIHPGGWRVKACPHHTGSEAAA